MTNEFESLGLKKQTVEILSSLEITKPTEIQSKTIPLIVEGKDVIGNAATGSGKTLAFASGIIEKTLKGKGIQALVMAPTRELAIQIAGVLRTFSNSEDLKVTDIYGGVSMSQQVSHAPRSEVLVGTPGRILDHLERGTFNLDKLKVLVLDEADRMVDMGFLKDVETIIKLCNPERQTLLFSATSSPDIDYIEKKYMKNAKHIAVKQYVDASLLTQVFYDTPDHKKFSLLVHLLKKEKTGIILVFCNTRRNVDLVAYNLQRYKIHSHAIHGGLDQNKRTKIIEQFHKNEAEILVCTDVAARGLDIQGVSHVYNFDIPPSSEEYIHRIGRTARAGKEGMAVCIVTSRDYMNFRKVLEDDSLKIKQLNLPDNLEDISPKFQHDRKPRFDNRKRGEGNSRPQRDGSSGPHRKRFGSSSHRNSGKPRFSNRVSRGGPNPRNASKHSSSRPRHQRGRR